MHKDLKIIVEKHTDGCVAYPLGIKGVVVGEGDTYEEALADVRSAIVFHIETFGPTVFNDDEQFTARRSNQLRAKFSCRKWTGRVLATTREVLRATAQRLGLHHLVNLAGLDPRPASRKQAPDG